MKAVIPFARQTFFKIASFSQSLDDFWNLYNEDTMSAVSF